MKLLRNLLPLGIALTFCGMQQSHGQLVSGNVFLKGNYVEVGIAPNQQYGTNTGAPTGYHPRGWGAYPSNALGFVADPGMDGWTVGTPNYIGCYFLPGFPQEGWDMSIDGTWFRSYAGFAPYGEDRTISPVGGYTFTGTNTAYWTVGSQVKGKWEGSINDLQITTVTTLDTLQRFFIGEVKLKNTGTVTYTDIFYSRTLDPDNESAVPGGGGPTTTNVIHYQPDVATGEMRALVSATGTNFPTLSYLGIGAVDCRAKVYVYPSALNPSTGPHTIPTSTSFQKGVGFTNVTDCAIGIMFDIGNLAPGDSTVFSYVYVLRIEDLDSGFSAVSSGIMVDSFAYGENDTFYGCVGDTVDVSITGGEHYNWDYWSPSTGLLLPPGRTNQILVTSDTITYTIVGTTPFCDISDTIRLTVLPYVLGNPGGDTTVEMCGNVPTLSLTSLLAGDPDPGGVWTGPGVSPTGLFTPSGLSEGTYVFTYTQTTGFCDTFSTLTIQIVNDVDLDFDYEILRGCDQDSIQFTNLTDSLVYFRWNYGDGSPHDTVNYSPLHIYEDQGSYFVWLIGMNERGCVDSMLKTIEINHSIAAIINQSTDSVCQSDGINTVYFFDMSTGNVVNRLWDFGDGTTSTLATPSHSYPVAGTYNITLVVTDDVPCSDTAYATVYVDSAGGLKIKVDKEDICSGDQVRINAEYTNTIQNLTWNFGDGSIAEGVTPSMTHSYPDPGEYYISVIADQAVCPDMIAYDTVSVKQYPQINLGPDTQLCLKGAPIFLDPTIMVNNPPGTIYYWSTGDTMTVLKITEPGTYRVTANLDGCVTSDEIEVNKDCYTDIPNSFTPNDDGVNDYFFPRQLLSEGVVDFKMTIYNRWGEVIFETTNPDGRGWDGKFNNQSQPMGVYVYQISVRYKNQAAEKYTGNVTLLR